MRIAVIARADVGEHVLVMRGHSALEQLAHAALRADFGRGGDEQLHLGVGGDDRADVAPVEDRSAGLAGELPLAFEQCRADRRIGRDRRGDARHRFAAQFLVGGVDAQHVARPQSLELVAGIAAPAPQVERHRAVEQPGVHVRQAVVPRDGAGDGPLPARRRSVDRDHEIGR